MECEHLHRLHIYNLILQDSLCTFLSSDTFLVSHVRNIYLHFWWKKWQSLTFTDHLYVWCQYNGYLIDKVACSFSANLSWPIHSKHYSFKRELRFYAEVVKLYITISLQIQLHAVYTWVKCSLCKCLEKIQSRSDSFRIR